jgi:hypothetical protein
VPLETATYISDLVTSNPAASDPLSGADDHIRLIKATIKATFPNFTGRSRCEPKHGHTERPAHSRLQWHH